MIEQVIKLYEFNELSDESQKAVVERLRDTVGEDSAQSYSEDWAASLNKFEKLMGVTVRYNVQYDGSGSDYSFDFDKPIFYNSECTIMAHEVKGRLLARFLDKIYYDIRSRKFIHDGIRDNALRCNGKKSRFSRIIWIENNCPLTGCIYDCPLLEPIYKWQRKWDMELTLEELVGRCLDKFFSEWESDMEGCYSDDFVRDSISANSSGDLYYEDGTLYNGPRIA